MILSVIPLWLPFAFAASLCAAAGMYMHQRMKAESAASAIWLKIIGVCVAAPVLIRTGLPSAPLFYVFTAAAAAMWCANDLIYFRAVHRHGAALLSRLLPFAIVASFFAWFIVKPALLHGYLQDIPRFAGVCCAIFLAVISAYMAKRCPYSLSALKSIWFVLFAAVVGTFLVKEAVDLAPDAKGVFGYVGIEAALMLVFYALWFTLRDRNAYKAVFGPRGIKTGLIVGGFMVGSVVLNTFAQQHVDHPAYASMIYMLDVVWLMVLTRLSGWKDDSNKLAGFGIVVAALMLTFLKIK